MLAVFLLGGGPDHLELSPAEGGLEDVGGVDGALGGACPDEGVQLVDEENHIAQPLYLPENPLDPLLKLPPVLGARHRGGEIYRQNPFVQQGGGHLMPGDPLSQGLGNGGLAHPRVSQQHRVVLAPAAESSSMSLDRSRLRNTL